MKKNSILKRALCLVLTLVVGMSMTLMGVYAAEGAEGVEGVEGVEDVGAAAKTLEVKAEKVGNGYAVVSWDAPEGITTEVQYILSYEGLAEPFPTTTETTYTFNGLENWKSYKIKVTCEVEGVSYEGTVDVTPVYFQAVTFEALRDYDGVTLKWSVIKDKAVTKYKIYRDGKYVPDADVENDINKDTLEKYVGDSGYTLKTLDKLTHSYSVAACYEYGDKYREVMSNTQRQSCVRPMYVTVVLKTKRTLTSHTGGKVKITLRAGTKLTTIGFGSGKYKFYRNGRLYYVKRTSTRSAKCLYTGKYGANYTPTEAQNFVNHAGYSSRTKYLLWANGYTQRVYVFTGSKYNWQYKDSWEICTGKASAPSPTGVKKIHKKIKKRNGLKWWSCYSSYNSFHGAFKSWVKKLGTPQTSGCFRNPNGKAEWIYKYVPRGSTVISY
ncbi:MAG: L,D-transpeptidase [Lentihominibacter sp.]